MLKQRDAVRVDPYLSDAKIIRIGVILQSAVMGWHGSTGLLDGVEEAALQGAHGLAGWIESTHDYMPRVIQRLLVDAENSGAHGLLPCNFGWCVR